MDGHCCFIPAGEQEAERPDGCLERAVYEILDLADPNPYTAVTHSCTAHVGELLGHDESVPGEAPQHWEVRPI